MRTWIAGAAFAAALGAGAAYAGTMDNMYGNTVVVNPAGGGTILVRFEPNQTYSITLPDGTVGGGAWAMNGAQICMTPTGGQQECHPFAENKAVGDTWTATEPDGTTTTLTIRQGR